jgi:hypothetical protein
MKKNTRNGLAGVWLYRNMVLNELILCKYVSRCQITQEKYQKELKALGLFYNLTSKAFPHVFFLETVKLHFPRPPGDQDSDKTYNKSFETCSPTDRVVFGIDKGSLVAAVPLEGNTSRSDGKTSGGMSSSSSSATAQGNKTGGVSSGKTNRQLLGRLPGTFWNRGERAGRLGMVIKSLQLHRIERGSGGAVVKNAGSGARFTPEKAASGTGRAWDSSGARVERKLSSSRGLKQAAEAANRTVVWPSLAAVAAVAATPAPPSAEQAAASVVEGLWRNVMAREILRDTYRMPWVPIYNATVASYW